MPSAVEAVFDTAELLEIILHKLPNGDVEAGMYTLLQSQRVCRKWKQVIEGSAKLQRALFFKPIDTEALKHRVHTCQSICTDDEFPSDTMTWRTRDWPKRFIYGNPLLSSLFYDARASSTTTYGRPNLPASWQHVEASWKRMLLTHPGVNIHYATYWLEGGHGDWTVEFNTKEQRVGEIHENIVSKIASTGRAGDIGGNTFWEWCADAEQIEELHVKGLSIHNAKLAGFQSEC